MRAIDYFDKGADKNPDRMAVIGANQELTFREAQERTHRIARAMWANGLEKQEHVAIYSPNDPGVMLTLLGLLRAGAVWIPVNTRNALDANVQFLNYVKAKWLFYHSYFNDDVARLKKEVPSFVHFICLDKRQGDDPSLEEFMQQGSEKDVVDWADAYGNPDWTVGIFPTGGTTGPAKGVDVRNLGWGTMMQMAMNYWYAPDVEPVILTVAPMTHAAGPIALALSALGGTNVIMPGFDAGKVLENIEKYNVTHMFLPPTALYGLLDHPDLKKRDTSSLRRFLLVGSAVSPARLKEAVEVFGPCMCQCYGQVESPMIITWLDPETVAQAAAGDHPERLMSAGRPSYAVKVAILDDDGNIQPPGKEGEICVRGTLVSAGYYLMPEATEEIRAFNWHHTGDVGYMDEDGFLYIVDRKKDMIVTGGFNVFSSEVENAVTELDAVSECIVVGAPHDKWGEAVTAVIALKPGKTITEDEVIQHCKDRLGGVKAPKSVHFWEELPRTAAGKPDKKAVRDHFWKGAERRVH